MSKLVTGILHLLEEPPGDYFEELEPATPAAQLVALAEQFDGALMAIRKLTRLCEENVEIEVDGQGHTLRVSGPAKVLAPLVEARWLVPDD